MRSLRILFAFGLAVSSALASQGVVLTPGETLGFQLNNSAPFPSVTSTRVDMRFHAWSVPATSASIVNLPQFQVRLMGTAYNAPLAITDWLDYFPPGQSNTIFFDITGMTDIIVRVQRDAVANTLSAQVWNANGSGTPLSASLSIAGIIPAPLPSNQAIGDASTSCVLDYVRWYSSTVPSTTSPFSSGVGDLGDMEFEGTLADSSGNALGISPSMPVNYGASPVYPPFASQGPQRVMRAGVPQQLDGTSSHALNGSNTLTYSWSQISGSTQLSWSSTTAAKPTITGLVFGSYQIQLKVTDSSGQSSYSVLKYGAVSTTANDVVIPPSPYIAQIFGPMLRLGASPWPYFDSSNQAMADFFGGLQATDYIDVWNQAKPGTITVTNGSPTVTGMGTTFMSTYCGGGNAPSNGSMVIAWYTVPGTIQHGRSPWGVASCQSDTELTLAQPYTAASESGISYAYMDNTSMGIWINGSSNANYYDNVMAFYGLYYRSGLDDYLNYARTLADRWYSMPWFDGGRASADGRTFLFPRLQSLTGMILRAFDGQPSYWSGIDLFVNADYNFAAEPLTAGYAMGDIREQGYATGFVALAAMYDPNATNRATYKSQVQSLISNVWAPAVQSGGNWVAVSYGDASWNGYSGTVSVSNNSVHVYGTGTNWDASWFSGNATWTADPNGVSEGDGVSYVAQVISPTELLLDKPYQGPTASGRGWQTSNLVGVGTEPFMLGIVGQGFRFALMATGDTRLPGFIKNIAGWLSTTGYRPDARGLWYARTYPNCEPVSTDNQWCSGGTVEQSRFLSGEVVGLMSTAFGASQDPTVLAFGDNLFGAMFGGPTGGPQSDTTYVTDVGPGGWAMQTKYAKDFGFFYGFGGGPSWPAARLSPKLGGQRPR